MSEDQFAGLFKYMEKRFDAVDDRFWQIEQKFDKCFCLLNNSISSAGEIDIHTQEMAAMDHKIRRLEKYIQALADKVGVDLDTVHV